MGKTDTTTVTVLVEDGEPVVLEVKGEQLLRTALLANKVEIYGGMAKLTNCGGVGNCGTCAIDVVSADSGSVFSDRTLAEERKFGTKKPASFRLACQVVTQGGEVTIKTKPKAYERYP